MKREWVTNEVAEFAEQTRRRLGLANHSIGSPRATKEGKERGYTTERLKRLGLVGIWRNKS